MIKIFKIWLNTTAILRTAVVNTRSHLSAILRDLKKINLKKMGSGRFRGSGGDDHQLFYEALSSLRTIEQTAYLLSVPTDRRLGRALITGEVVKLQERQYIYLLIMNDANMTLPI